MCSIEENNKKELIKELRLCNGNFSNVMEKCFYSIDPVIDVSCIIDEISKSFGVDKKSIILCGSLRLGYSLSPKKNLRYIDEAYNETNLIKYKSDIDIAIVDENLFYKLKQRIFKYTNGLNNKWYNNEYYKDEKKEMTNDFFRYNYKGWFRPDFKPLGFEICNEGSLEDLKKYVECKLNRKLAIAIYQDKFFFEQYYLYGYSVLHSKILKGDITI